MKKLQNNNEFNAILLITYKELFRAKICPVCGRRCNIASMKEFF